MMMIMINDKGTSQLGTVTPIRVLKMQLSRQHYNFKGNWPEQAFSFLFQSDKGPDLKRIGSFPPQMPPKLLSSSSSLCFCPF